MLNKFIQEHHNQLTAQKRKIIITHLKQFKNNKTFYDFIDSKTIESPPWMKLKVLKTNQQINSNCKLLCNSPIQTNTKRISQAKQQYIDLVIKKMSAIRPVSVSNQKQMNNQMPNYTLNINLHRQILQQRKRIWMKYSQIQPSAKLWTYYLGPGNNHELVRRVMKQRVGWTQYQAGVSKCINFKWQQTNYNYNYSEIQKRNSLQILNHFEHHEEISTKSGLIKNLQLYCQTNKIQIFTITPITFIINLQSDYAENQIKKFIKYFIRKDQPKSDKQMQLVYDAFKKIKPILKQGCQLKKKTNPFSKPVFYNTYYNGKNLWLLKPIGLNRGRGIQLFNSIQQLQKLLRQFKQLSLSQRKKKLMAIKYSIDKMITDRQIIPRTAHEKSKTRKRNFKIKKLQRITQSTLQKPQTSNQSNTHKNYNLLPVQTLQFVIQKYIQKPLLIQGRKFDIRVWVLIDLKFEVYIFKQGYIRTSSQLFNLNDIDNYYIHLTNNAIQKNSQNYGCFEKGNQLNFQDFQNLMKKQNPSFTMFEVFNKIKQISYITMSAVKKKLDPHHRSISFQLFGLDFILDQNYKVWLIEVNTNPCIQESSPLLQILIPRLINDTFKLTIDEYFKNEFDPSKYKQSKQMKEDIVNKQFFSVNRYKDNENMFESLGKLKANYFYSKKQSKGDQV